MAFTATLALATGGTNTDNTTFTSGSFSVTAGDLLVAFVANGIAVAPATTPTTALGGTLGGTLTWAQIDTVLMNSSQVGRVTALRAQCPSGATGTVSFSFGATTQSNCQWTIVRITGHDTASPVVRSQTAQTASANPSMTLSPAPQSDSMVIGAVIANLTTAATAGTGYTVIGTGFSGSSPALRLGVQYDLTSPSATFGFTLSGTTNKALLAIEIAPQSGTSQDVPLTTEADSTVAVGRAKSKAATTLAETDAAQAIGRAKAKAVPVVTETNEAVAVGISFSDPAVPTVTETDATVTIGRAKRRTVPVVVETDATVTIGRAKRRTTATLTEADVAQTIGRRRSRAVPTTTELDIVVAPTRRKAKAVPVAAELDAAGLVTSGFDVLVPVVTETDSTVTIGRRKSRAVPVVLEVGAAQLVARRKALTVPVAAELDAAVLVTVGAVDNGEPALDPVASPVASGWTGSPVRRTAASPAADTFRSAAVPSEWTGRLEDQ